MSIALPESLATANREFARTYPGDPAGRQPVHCVYGGAHLFKADLAKRFGILAGKSLFQYAPDPATLALAVGIPNKFADVVYERVLDKLRQEPVEEFRIDFEDGYGSRPDAEEDAAVQASAEAVAHGMAAKSLPPFLGIRIKPLSEELKERSIRTLDLFFGALLKKAGRLPDPFVVTLPKVNVPEQVHALLATLAPFRSVQMEIMVETPQAVLSLPALIAAAERRCTAVHFGPYDYTASLGITSANQDLLHPACNFARSMMQVAAAGRGIRLSDGPTNILPVPAHRGDSVTPQQMVENRAVVHRAWQIHYRNVRHALDNGFYQGWDLHPAQLVSRYAAVYSFFLEGLDAASARLRNFVKQAARATMVGDVFDDAATGQGLLNYFVRALNCGAIPESDAPALTGLTIEELHSGSFAKILKGRGANAPKHPNANGAE
jgi:citrate lyase beta subunit